MKRNRLAPGWIVVSLFAAFLALAALPADPVHATDYFVQPGGSDAADGLAPGSAWATLQHASDTIVSGDTVHVADGDYAGFDVRLVASEALPVAFVALGSAARIVADNPVTPDGINIEDSAYIRVEGFVIEGRTRAGIRAAVSDHITVRGCTSGDNGTWGIFSGFVDDFLVENNHTYGSVAEHGIYVSNSSVRPIVRGNVSENNNGAGIHMNGDSSQGGSGLIANALVEGNVISSNGVGGGSAINMDGVVDSVVQNNLMFDNHASGISLFRQDGAEGSRRNLVINNTILNAADARWAVNITGGAIDNTVVNNILWNEHPFRGVITVDASSRAGLVADYNSVMAGDRFSIDGGNSRIDLAAWRVGGYGAQSYVATPTDHFIAPGVDHRLLLSSPAIDAGTLNGAPGSDLAGDPRPVGAGIDTGCYEQQLLECGDGDADAGEQCGEPGLPACTGACTTCSGCTCAPTIPVCGDLEICAEEECELDADCAPGDVCVGCACVAEPACASGVTMEKAKLSLNTDNGKFSVKGQAEIPEPWAGIDPPISGLRLVVDDTDGTTAIDATVPGGGAWASGGGGTRWSFRDRTGAVAGIEKISVKDKRKRAPGLVQWKISGKSGGLTLPDAAVARTYLLFGAAEDCAGIEWNPPGGASPACSIRGNKLRCR